VAGVGEVGEEGVKVHNIKKKVSNIDVKNEFNMASKNSVFYNKLREL
jgi:hypothetical protein